MLDDGSISRSAVGRLAVYAGQDVAVVGRGPERLARALADVGIIAHSSVDDGVAARPLSQWSADIIVIGPPFDDAELVDRVQELVRSGAGRLVHVLASRSGRSPKVIAATRDTIDWTRPVAATLRDTWGIPVVPAADVMSDDSDITDTDGDLIIVATRATAPDDAQVSLTPSTPTVSAADVVHVVLTDAGLIVTNRTPLIVDIRVRLGRMGNASVDLVCREFTLSPRRTRALCERELGAVGDLPGPVATVRHWSHETETIYEGGERRINGVDVRYRDVNGAVLAAAHHDCHRGLVVGITGDRIARDLGASLQSLSQRWADREQPVRSLDDLIRTIS